MERLAAEQSSPWFSADALTEAQVRAAVSIANVPTLLMVVFQTTGDERWLRAPYLPTRGKGLVDHDDGGLPEEVQAEVRDAAVKAILDLQRGLEPAITNPSPELTTRMMSVCMGEPVGSEYGPMLHSEIARRVDPSLPELQLPPVHAPEGYKVLVIGTGVAGIAAAQQLEDMGMDYTILERQSEGGGNWLQNTYPGAGVDTPSHLYSFSFAKNDWEKHFEMRDNLMEYFNRVLKDLGAHERIRWETTVLRAAYDEDRANWTVEVRGPDGAEETLIADVLISAVGVLNQIKFPRVPGMEHLRRDGVPLRGMARGLQPGRQTGRHCRHWRQLDADLTGHRRERRAPDHLPALAAVGGAVRQVPAAHSPRTADAHAVLLPLPRVVLDPAVLAVRRQGDRGTAEGP